MRPSPRLHPELAALATGLGLLGIPAAAVLVPSVVLMALTATPFAAAVGATVIAEAAAAGLAASAWGLGHAVAAARRDDPEA